MIAKLRSALGGFSRETRGVAALEFAMLLPAMIGLYFGTVELVRILDANRKVSLFSRALADLSGRADNPSPSTSDMGTISTAAGAILRPLNTAGLQIIVNAMGVKSTAGTLSGSVCSSWAQNAITRPALQASGTSGLPPIPSAYQFDGARYILAEVSMSYTPLVGATLYRWIFGPNGLSFSRQVPWAERTASEIIMPGGSKCPT